MTLFKLTTAFFFSFNLLLSQTALGTITNVKVKGFDIQGDRLYTINPGTNSSSDNAAYLSIVNLTTNKVVAAGGEYSPTTGGISGYPDHVWVFDSVAVVCHDGGFSFFNVSRDSVNYISNSLFTRSISGAAMHSFKRGKILYAAIQSKGFAVFDMSDPMKPVTLHEKDYGLSGDYPYSIFADDKHVYLSDYNESVVYIHKNGSDYALVGTTPTGAKGARVITHGSTLYIGNGMVYDITDPTTPVVDSNADGINIGSSNGEFRIFDSYALVSSNGYKSSTANDKAHVYKLSTDADGHKDAEKVLSLQDTLPSYDIRVHNEKLYVAFGRDTSGGYIKIFDANQLDKANTAPASFDWISSASDTINISKTNIQSSYTLQWSASNDPDGDLVNYLIYVKIGAYPKEEIYDTTVTTLSIPYQEFLDYAFEGIVGPAVTVRFSAASSDGRDKVDIAGADRVIYINRYDFLSTEEINGPTDFALHDNFPNPFNPSTQIRFDMPITGDVRFTIYNMLGQKVREYQMNSLSAGYHTLTWNATNDIGDAVSAGIYFYQIKTKEFLKTKRMVLLK